MGGKKVVTTPFIAIPKLIFTLACLSVASYMDWQKREIDDLVWILLGLVGASFTAIELVIDPSLLLIASISMAISFILGYSLYYLNLTGGADAKAIWTLGLTYPYSPHHLPPPILPIQPLYPITIVANAALLSLTAVLYNLIYNATLLAQGETLFRHKLPYWKKVTLLLTAYKADIRTTDWNKNFPLEALDTAVIPPTTTITLFTGADVEVDSAQLIENVEQGLLPERIWTSLGIPMILFITLGLVASLIVGDVVFTFIVQLFAWI